MNNIELRTAATETLKVYSFLDEECKSKVPKDFLEFLEINKDPELTVNITRMIPLYLQKISKEGFNLIYKMFEYIC